jgi:monofunctional glycosyltransferase
MSKKRTGLFRKIICLFLFLFAVLLAVVVTVLQVLVLRYHNPQSTAWMRMRVRQAAASGKDLKIKHTWIPLSSMPRYMKLAVIAAEDDKFYQHHGFDWEAIQDAWKRNDKADKIKRGGSTITQQLAKNLFLSPSRSYVRKAREAFITFLLELMLPKDRILELYLNSIEFGPGIFGVEEGARYHFGVSARQLSLDQCCRLAAIIPSPLRYRATGPYVTRRAENIAQIIAGPQGQ